MLILKYRGLQFGVLCIWAIVSVTTSQYIRRDRVSLEKRSPFPQRIILHVVDRRYLSNCFIGELDSVTTSAEQPVISVTDTRS